MKKTRKQPNVSVITVCYNCESTIESTVKSALEQNYPSCEYIIIDGGSTDKTVDIIKQYAGQIECIISEKDNGIYDAMNKGIDICKGDYVFFLNSGDRFYNNSVITDIMTKSSGQDIIYGDLMLDDKKDSLKKHTQPAKINRFLFICRTISHQATFVKLDMFQKYGKFDEKYKISADVDFFLRVIFKSEVSIVYIPVIISFYNMYGISSDPKTSALRYRDRLRIQKEHLPFFYYLMAKLRFFLLNRQHKYIPRQFLRILNKILLYYAWK